MEHQIKKLEPYRLHHYDYSVSCVPESSKHLVHAVICCELIGVYSDNVFFMAFYFSVTDSVKIEH
jgi:hypothetical protein